MDKVTDIGGNQDSIEPNYLKFRVVTAFVTNLDIVVTIIINRLYIPIIYLLVSQSIFLSICLSVGYLCV